MTDGIDVDPPLVALVALVAQEWYEQEERMRSGDEMIQNAPHGAFPDSVRSAASDFTEFWAAMSGASANLCKDFGDRLGQVITNYELVEDAVDEAFRSFQSGWEYH